MKEILLTGGTGYIGSHTVRFFANQGFKPIIYDNLTTGFTDFIEGFELIQGDIGDYDKLISLFRKRKGY